ncbi:MAG TPA: adenylyl-sulfate kinase, partial [Acidimicrobiia bacterium]
MTRDILWHHGAVPREVRHRLSGGPGLTVWLTGLSASGKSTLAFEAELRLMTDGRVAYVLDGDNIRHGL